MMIHISARCCVQLFPQLPCTHKDDIATFGCHPQITGVRLKVKTATSEANHPCKTIRNTWCIYLLLLTIWVYVVSVGYSVTHPIS